MGYRYDSVVGTGGIGAGIAFRLLTDEPLGRNESRPAELLPARDYCKGHIVLHYVATLLRTGTAGAPAVIPVGRVGDDSDGHRLLGEIRATGMSTQYVVVDPALPTLYAVSFQYPDSSGGNFTASNSASGALSATDVMRPFEAARATEDRSVVVALPEVPLEARLRLLKEGWERGAFTVASIVSAEAAAFEAAGGWALVDLVALNVDEAAAVAGIHEDVDGGEIARRCAAELWTRHPNIVVIVTDGSHGSYLCVDGEVEHTPALQMTPVSTAGAGDAFLAGILVGLICGLPLQRRATGDGSHVLSTAVDLGALLGSLSVTSPHTIHPEVDAAALAALVAGRGLAATEQFVSLFASPDRLVATVSPVSQEA